MGYNMGVLLFHCTEYGRADFDIQGVAEGLICGIANRISKKDVEYGFMSEAENYFDLEDEDRKEEFKALFKETWHSFMDEEN